MIQRYIEINRILRKIVYFAWDAIHPQTEDYTQVYISSYLQREIRELERLWPQGITKRSLVDLRENAKRCDRKNFIEIIDKVIPKIEDTLDNYFSSQPTGDITVGIIDFLHPAIIASSYGQFRNGHYRDAVFNSVVAVFDLIRKKTNIDKDGSNLVEEVFSLTRPKLVISNLDTESGRDEQKGYIEILRGAYLAVRNPKAHSLLTDLDEFKAAQYLIFASLLARRVDEAHIVSEGIKQ